MDRVVEVVTHCYAKELPHYASALGYHLYSMRYSIQKGWATSTVCFSPEDEATMIVLRYFRETHDLSVKEMPMDAGTLGRRSIGRNRAALESKADYVWFSDVDQCFADCYAAPTALEHLGIGVGYYNKLTFRWPEGCSMVFPQQIFITHDHALGDKYLKEMRWNDNAYALGDILSIEDFKIKRYNRAIGGVQIVKGDFAREHGYLNGIDRWQQPTEKPFSDFRDDVAYRQFCLQHGKIVGVDLTPLNRIRHSTTSYQ